MQRIFLAVSLFYLVIQNSTAEKVLVVILPVTFYALFGYLNFV